MADTCGSCKHYIGGGDWSLCCDLKYDLCYRFDEACENYVYSEEKGSAVERAGQENRKDGKGTANTRNIGGVSSC